MQKKMKPNAVLVWKGRKLMCGRVPVAVIGPTIVGSAWWYQGGYMLHRNGVFGAKIYGGRATLAATMRAVNRRFGLPAEYGVSKP